MNESIIVETGQVRTLAELFRERVRRTPSRSAYQYYDVGRQRWVDTNWADMALEVGRWQQALLRSGMQQGDRVAIMLRNSREWVLFDQAALGLGLVTVPLFVDDRPENALFILNETGAKLLLVDGKQQWQNLAKLGDRFETIEYIVSVAPITAEDSPADARLESLSDWLFGLQGELQTVALAPNDLATIVYTSGTTGSPKGVMLSHRNMLTNANDAAELFRFNPYEKFLSFLPLSHMFERTAGYHVPMINGFVVAYNRSIAQMPDDLLEVRPTALVSVPRIYERFYMRVQETLAASSILRRMLFSLTLHVGTRRHYYRQGLAAWSPLLLLWPMLNKLVAKKVLDKLGGRMHMAVCGGAALPKEVDVFFNALGLSLYEGYGLTEASPVISVSQEGSNKPGSIGQAMKSVMVRIADDGELQAKGDNIMLGYWHNPEATVAIMTEDGWLRTGDLARIDSDGCIYITGRSKDIVVLSNGEKVPPADMEMAITMDPLFEQALVVGEGRPALTLLVVVNSLVWSDLAREFKVDADDVSAFNRHDVKQRLLDRISSMLKQFPGYAQVKNLYATLEPWTVENGLLTPTLKYKRPQLLEFYRQEIEAMYNRNS